MARILITEPVSETRDLLERLVVRLGHELVGAEAMDTADAVLFEPECPRSVTLVSALRDRHPDLALVAVSSLPSGGEPLPGGVARVTQPFEPAELGRALSEALAVPVAAHAPA